MDITRINNAFNKLFMRMLNAVVIVAEQYCRLIQWDYNCIDDMKEMTEIAKEIKLQD